MNMKLIESINDIVTTVPLSVSYGALNLLVRVDTSNFVPYVCDRAVTRGVRGSRKYRTAEIMTATCIFSYFYIATWDSNLKGKKYFAGDITHRIKLCCQTSCLFP